ncbi:hypothetical protein ACFE04_031053 [Oxalis oulophora]
MEFSSNITTFIGLLLVFLIIAPSASMQTDIHQVHSSQDQQANNEALPMHLPRKLQFTTFNKIKQDNPTAGTHEKKEQAYKIHGINNNLNVKSSTWHEWKNGQDTSHYFTMDYSHAHIIDSIVKYDETFIINSRGYKLFTCSWVPRENESKALIFLCSPWALDCSVAMKSTSIRLAKLGFGVYGIDYQGHGKSAGPTAYIDNFDLLVDDCHKHFTKISEKEENLGKKKFLFGEAMGGAVALHLHLKNHNIWDGAILVAPMCQVAEKLKPHPLFRASLKTLTKINPKLKLCPTSVDEIIDLAYKEHKARKEMRENPYYYKGRPCLKTGEEVLKSCATLEKKLHEVRLPFLILQGGEDRVVDMASSEHLYTTASSSDKSFRIYPKMWHSLLHGEPQENITIVFADIVKWLNERVPSKVQD